MFSTKDPNSKDDLILKLQGKVEIPTRLEIGHNYTIRIGGSITAITESDRNDGGRIMYYKFEPVQVELITETGKTLKLKDTRKESQKLRSKLFMVHQETPDLIVDFDIWYAKVMQSIRLNAEEIIKQYYPKE